MLHPSGCFLSVHEDAAVLMHASRREATYMKMFAACLSEINFRLNLGDERAIFKLKYSASSLLD